MAGNQSKSVGAARSKRVPSKKMGESTDLPKFVDVKEQKRLNDAREMGIPWKKWGPYLSERQWGTVREDYSQDGNAWAYFSHDQSRSRAYHWGEDGLAGSRMISNACALPSPFGTSVIPSSRSAYSGSPTARGTTVRTSRNTTSI